MDIYNEKLSYDWLLLYTHQGNSTHEVLGCNSQVEYQRPLYKDQSKNMIRVLSC